VSCADADERRWCQASTPAHRLEAATEHTAVARVARGVQLRADARDALGNRGERGQNAEQEVAAYRQGLEQPADGAREFPGERAWGLRAATAGRPMQTTECPGQLRAADQLGGNGRALRHPAVEQRFEGLEDRLLDCGKLDGDMHKGRARSAEAGDELPLAVVREQRDSTDVVEVERDQVEVVAAALVVALALGDERIVGVVEDHSSGPSRVRKGRVGEGGEVGSRIPAP